jgi:Domain of unknown function (DUF4118)
VHKHAMNAGARIELISLVVGGVLGILFAWISESTGHAPWAMLLMLACSVLPTFVIPLPEYSPLQELCIWCFAQSKRTRAAFVFILVATTLIIEQSLGINPRAYNYLPFLPAVFVSNVLFGAGFALFATVLSLVMADYLFAAPVADVSGAAWQNIAVFVAFGVIGASVAWSLFSFVGVLSQDERDISET